MKSKRSQKGRIYFRKCVFCGKRDEQRNMYRYRDMFFNGFICEHCLEQHEQNHLDEYDYNTF